MKTNPFPTMRLIVPLAAAAALAACGDRTAESETPVAEAEVQTELPETVVSDAQLQATADAAADMASAPPPAVVAVPVAGGATGTTSNQTGGTAPAAGATANQTQ